MMRIANEYTRKASLPWERIRFDIVSVLFAKPPKIEHIKKRPFPLIAHAASA